MSHGRTEVDEKGATCGLCY